MDLLKATGLEKRWTSPYDLAIPVPSLVSMATRSRRYQATHSCLEWIKTAVSTPILTSRFYHSTGYSLDDVLFVLDLADEPLHMLENSKLPEKDLRQLHNEFSGLRHSFVNLRTSRTFHVLAHFRSPNHVLCCFHRTHHRKDFLEKTGKCTHSNIFPINPLGSLWADHYESWNLLNSLLIAHMTNAPTDAVTVEQLNATGPIERSHDSHWLTTFRTAIVDSRIMVEVTGQHWPTRFIHLENTKPVHRTCHFCLDRIHVGPLSCPHVQLLPPTFQQVRKLEVGSGREEGYVLEDSDRHLDSEKTELSFDSVRKCPHCPSEYMYSSHLKGGLESVQITRWVDFGTCQTPWDTAWTDLTRWNAKSGVAVHEYGALRAPESELVRVWEQPALLARNLSIRSVFEHAMCSEGNSDEEDTSDTTWSSVDRKTIYSRIREGVSGFVRQVTKRSSSCSSQSRLARSNVSDST